MDSKLIFWKDVRGRSWDHGSARCIYNRYPSMTGFMEAFNCITWNINWNICITINVVPMIGHWYKRGKPYICQKGEWKILVTDCFWVLGLMFFFPPQSDAGCCLTFSVSCASVLYVLCYIYTFSGVICLVQCFFVNFNLVNSEKWSKMHEVWHCSVWQSYGVREASPCCRFWKHMQNQ